MEHASESNSGQSNGVLDGVRVLDFSRVLAGPFATRMLADMGADVVKVEPPEGDVTRLLGKKVSGIGGYFHQQNAGKRDICLDMKASGASELILKLVAKSDIVVENFRPGIMERFGLGWAELHKVKPDLVMLSISGFGQVGPERNRAAYAAVIHGESGLLARQAYVDKVQVPTDLPLSLADSFASLHGLAALLAALYSAKRTGVGQHIDLAMINAMFVSDDYAHLVLDGFEVTGPGGRIFEAPGGPVIVNGDDKLFWHHISTVHGLADPSPAGAGLEEKIASRRALVEEWFRSCPSREELIARLDASNLAWGNVYSHTEVWDRQASIVERHVLTQVDDRSGGSRRLPQSPYWFSDARSEVRGPAHFLGEDNETVLADWLNVAPTDVEDLKNSGVLHEAPRPTGTVDHPVALTVDTTAR
jgi:CoA:oxalate CoA-transferase